MKVGACVELVNRLAIDSDQNKWCKSNIELMKYDGSDFTVISAYEPHEFPYLNGVVSFAPDGTLWNNIALGGIATFVRTDWQEFTIEYSGLVHNTCI